MMRVCNLDTCPVGIATQNPELRKRFTGKPEYVVNFMRFIAQELREHMARLGVRTVDELVGRTDLLKVREHAVTERAATVDLSAILDNPYAGDAAKSHFDPADVYDFQLEETVDLKVLLKKLSKALENGEKPAHRAGGLLHRPDPGHHLRLRDHPALRQQPCRTTPSRSSAPAAAASPSAPSSPRG